MDWADRPLRSFRGCALALAVLASVVAALLGAGHDVLLIHSSAASGAVEWDFYYAYARDAMRIVNGQVPLDEYRGPVYPLVLALLSAAMPSVSVFAIAKAVAATSAGLTILAVYLLGEEILGPECGLAAALGTAASAPVVVHGFLVGTDMVFAAVVLWAVYFTARAVRRGTTLDPVVAGVLGGIAMSTRWNAAFVPAAGVAALALAIDRPVAARLRAAGLLALAFAVTTAPWLALNASLHGSPFYNRNYVNAALGIYDGGVSFDSLSQAVAYAPRYFVKRWLLNTADYAGRVALLSPAAGALAAAGAVALVARGRRRPALLVPVLFALGLFAVNALGPFVVRQYLVAIPLVMLAAAAALAEVVRAAGSRGARAAAAAAWVALAAWSGYGAAGQVRAVRDAEAKAVASQAMVGAKPVIPVCGDWNGDGRDDVGVSRDGQGYRTFYAFDGFVEGPATWTAAFGPERAYPIAGRWVAGRAAGIGVFIDGAFFLRYELSSGESDAVALMGTPQSTPLVGDWDGDGRDNIGVVLGGLFSLAERLEGAFVGQRFYFGDPGDQPVAGDWDGDGRDTVGVYRDGVFRLTNRVAPPFDDVWEVRSPVAGDVALAGDWDGDGRDTPTVFLRDGRFVFLEDGGATQWRVDLGRLTDLPVAGE